MSVSVTFYSGFAKRANSTKRPSGDGVTLGCVMKAGTSVESPSFLIDYDGDTIREWTYAKMGSHYYFIQDITLGPNRLTTVHCTQDVLATYKESIGSYSAMVARSSNAFDLMIEDSAITQKYSMTSRGHASASLPGWSTTGTYLLRVVGGSASQTSASSMGVMTYAVSAANIKSVLAFCFDQDNFIDSLTETITKALFNPFQYIVSLTWLPFESSRFSGATDSIYLGWWGPAASGVPVVTAETLHTYATISIPSGVYDDFRDYSSAWTQYMIYLPGVGTESLSLPMATRTIEVAYDVDIATGNCKVKIFDTSESANLIASYDGSLGVNIQIGQNKSDFAGMVTGAAAAAGAVISPAVMANPNADVSIIQGLKSFFQPMQSVEGSQGNMSSVINDPNVVVTMLQADSADIPLEYAGRPLYQIKTLSEIPGFIQCVGASVPLDALASDREAVNNYLNGGFYYE